MALAVGAGYGSTGPCAPRVTPWAQLLPAGWQGPRAGLPAPWPSWPRSCPCQDMLCPGSSLAPGALVPPDPLGAHGKGRAPRVDAAAQSSLRALPLSAAPALKGQHCPYHQRSPAHRGSQRPSSSCPPPAGHSWCHTGKSGSPAPGHGMGGKGAPTSPPPAPLAPW